MQSIERVYIKFWVVWDNNNHELIACMNTIIIPVG